MRVTGSLLLAGSLLLTHATTAGAAIDGKQDLVCEPQHLAQCDEAALCATVALSDIDFPPKLHVSFKDKKLSTAGGDRSSPIQSVEIDPAVLVLQGSQNGRGWSIVIDRATGSLSGTIADTEGAFILAGTCATP